MEQNIKIVFMLVAIQTLGHLGVYSGAKRALFLTSSLSGK